MLVKSVAVYVDEVALDMSVKFELSVDSCHCIEPLLPATLKVTVFVPVQIVVSPLVVPDNES